MNKLILCLVVLLSFSLHAQEEAGPEIVIEEEGESTPVATQVPEEPVESFTADDQPLEEAPVEQLTTEQGPAPAPVEEFVPPTKTPVEITSETEVEVEKRFNPYKAHWYSTFGFEAMEYELPFEYTGVKERFGKEKRQLYGGRIGVGGEVYLGAGFMTSTRLEGYYMGTLFESAKTADPTLPDEDVATVKDSGQIYGGDIVQTLSFMWDMKTKNPMMDTWAYLTVEPFIEAGIGKAWAFNKKDYSYNTSPEIVEAYDQSFTDELTNAKVGAGVNFTSSQGYFLYLKATQNRYDITKRRTKGEFNADNVPSAPITSNPSKDLDPIMVYSLGGGYKF